MFMKQEIPAGDTECWALCQEFLSNARNREATKKTVDKFIADAIHSIDFDDQENLDKVEAFIKARKSLLSPQHYAEFCAMTGLVVFALKDAALYAGVIEGKVPVFRKYKRLLHKKEKLEMILREHN